MCSARSPRGGPPPAAIAMSQPTNQPTNPADVVGLGSKTALNTPHEWPPHKLHPKSCPLQQQRLAHGALRVDRRSSRIARPGYRTHVKALTTQLLSPSHQLYHAGLTAPLSPPRAPPPP